MLWQGNAMAKVDIIIPAYNSAHFLAEALESVAAQTFTDWQIVLVDDGSTDNTPEVVAPFQQRFGEKLRYIRQENRGVSAARNRGIRSATSEFVAFLDADDIWLPRRLEYSLSTLEDRPTAGLCYGLLTRIDSKSVPLDTWHGNDAHVEGRIARYIYTREVELPCLTVTARRRCIEEAGYFDESMRATEDRDLWLRIARRYEVAFVPEVLALYRISIGSASANPDRMFEAQKDFIHKHYGQPECGFWQRQVALARAYKQRAEALQARGEKVKALRSALAAVAIYPLQPGNARTAISMLLSSVQVKRPKAS